MGNLCSKSANQPDNFANPGRTLGEGTQTRAEPAPRPRNLTATTPGRTLGASEGPSSPSDARSAAAKAAEVSKLVPGDTDAPGRGSCSSPHQGFLDCLELVY